MVATVNYHSKETWRQLTLWGQTPWSLGEQIKHAYEKLGVSDRAGAITAAIRRGLARPEGVV